jgi:hypothetical protein
MLFYIDMNNIIIILFLILNLMIKYVIIIPLLGEKLFLVFYLLSIVYFIHLERKIFTVSIVTIVGFIIYK